MNITVSGHHLEVTPAIRDYVKNKLERILRHFDQVIDITVTITLDKLKEKDKRHKADILLNVPGKGIHVESVSEDLYAAIDLLMDKLDRQVVKHKNKIQDHQHAPGKYISASQPDTHSSNQDDGTLGTYASA